MKPHEAAVAGATQHHGNLGAWRAHRTWKTAQTAVSHKRHTHHRSWKEDRKNASHTKFLTLPLGVCSRKPSLSQVQGSSPECGYASAKCGLSVGEP